MQHDRFFVHANHRFVFRLRLFVCLEHVLHLVDVLRVQLPHTPHFAESARGIAPRAAHRTVRKSLDLHGSCDREKAAAFRSACGLFLFPVDPDQTSVAGFLCSTIITIASTLLRSRPPLIRASVFPPRGSSACAFSLNISDQVLKFHTNA